MRRMVLTFFVVLAATLTVAGVYAAVGSRAAAAGPSGTELPPGWEPRPGTIVAVNGDPANGFRIDRHDGRVEFTTTWSETLAECGEYARPLARVRCRAESRGRYRALRGTVSALRFHQWQAAGDGAR